MEQMRPSILRRPLRSTNCTRESAEDQYLREQERIAAKSKRMLATETRLMGSLYPTPEVQQHRQQELERMKQEQLAAQAAKQRLEDQRLAAFTDARPATAPAPARPWEGASLSYSSRIQQDHVRKQLEAQLAEENKRMALAKALERQQQRQVEAAETRQQIQETQASFWNLGAVPGTGRFIAPEQRWMAAHNSRPMLSRPGSGPTSPTAAPAAAAAAAAPGIAGAAARLSVAGVKASVLTPPWATHTAPAPTRYSTAVSNSSKMPGRELNSSFGMNSSSMAQILGGSGTPGAGGSGVQEGEQQQQQQRPATAAPAVHKYPWEWPGA